MGVKSTSKNIFKSSIAVGLLTVIVKALGLFKQMIVAWQFGSSSSTDIYFIADGFVGPLANVIFHTICITFLSEYIYERKKEHRNTLVANVYIVYFVISIATAIIISIFAPNISKILAIGYSKDSLTQITFYIRILTCILPLYCIGAIAGTVLDGEKVFLPNKFQGGEVSLGIIVFCLLLSSQIGIYSLVIGTVFGYLFYMTINIFLSRKYYSISIFKPFGDKRVKKIITLSIPLMIGGAIDSIQAIIDKTIASNLGEGAVSELYYGQIISNDIIAGVFVSSIGMVFYSYFADFASNKETEKLKKSMIEGIKVLIIVLAFITATFLGSASKIVEIVFKHGSFSDNDVKQTSLVVLGYSFGFIFMAIREFHIKAIYAFQDTKSPMINGIIGMIVNCITSVIMAKLFGIVGIAIGTSVSYLIISILSIITLRKYLVSINYSELMVTSLKSLIAGMVCFILYCSIKKTFLFDSVVMWAISFSIMALIYIALLKIMKCNEICIIESAIRSKIKKKRGQ